MISVETNALITTRIRLYFPRALQPMAMTRTAFASRSCASSWRHRAFGTPLNLSSAGSSSSQCARGMRFRHTSVYLLRHFTNMLSSVDDSYASNATRCKKWFHRCFISARPIIDRTDSDRRLLEILRLSRPVSGASCRARSWWCCGHVWPSSKCPRGASGRFSISIWPKMRIVNSRIPPSPCDRVDTSRKYSSEGV